MHRLTCIRESEQGAIAAIVAMLFGFGVLLSLAALTVDVGNINADRRQLQNGADAVALAVAQKCVNDKTCAPVLSDGSLQTLVDANAADGATSIRRVDNGIGTTLAGQPAICGNAKDLTACPPTWTAGISKLQECPSTPASGLNYARVYAETANSDTVRKNILPYYFGAAITGIKGANQQACASVAWGPAVPPNPFPVTFSYCAWKAATGANPPSVPGTFVAPPKGPSPGYGLAGNAAGNTPWPAPDSGSEVTLYTKTNATTTCPTWNGHVAPGNFGTLTKDSNVGCSTTVVDGWVKGATGNADPCKPTNLLVSLLGHVIYVPIFDCDSPTQGNFDDCTNANGSHNWYHISGYAPFYLTGYYLTGTGSDGNSIYPPDSNARPCNNGERCISGWFTTGTLQDTPIDTSGAPNLGATAIKMNG